MPRAPSSPSSSNKTGSNTGARCSDSNIVAGPLGSNTFSSRRNLSYLSAPFVPSKPGPNGGKSRKGGAPSALRRRARRLGASLLREPFPSESDTGDARDNVPSAVMALRAAATALRLRESAPRACAATSSSSSSSSAVEALCAVAVALSAVVTRGLSGNPPLHAVPASSSSPPPEPMRVEPTRESAPAPAPAAGTALTSASACARTPSVSAHAAPVLASASAIPAHAHTPRAQRDAGGPAAPRTSSIHGISVPVATAPVPDLAPLTAAVSSLSASVAALPSRLETAAARKAPMPSAPAHAASPPGPARAPPSRAQSLPEHLSLDAGWAVPFLTVQRPLFFGDLASKSQSAMQLLSARVTARAAKSLSVVVYTESDFSALDAVTQLRNVGISCHLLDRNATRQQRAALIDSARSPGGPALVVSSYDSIKETPVADEIAHFTGINSVIFFHAPRSVSEYVRRYKLLCLAGAAYVDLFLSISYDEWSAAWKDAIVPSGKPPTAGLTTTDIAAALDTLCASYAERDAIKLRQPPPTSSSATPKHATAATSGGISGGGYGGSGGGCYVPPHLRAAAAPAASTPARPAGSSGYSGGGTGGGSDSQPHGGYIPPHLRR